MVLCLVLTRHPPGCVYSYVEGELGEILLPNLLRLWVVYFLGPQNQGSSFLAVGWRHPGVSRSLLQWLHELLQHVHSLHLAHKESQPSVEKKCCRA